MKKQSTKGAAGTVPVFPSSSISDAILRDVGSESYPRTVFVLVLADGSVVCGEIQGSGGSITGKPDNARMRLEDQIKRANVGKPLSCYEPVKGSIKLYLDPPGSAGTGTADGLGSVFVHASLVGASILSVEACHADAREVAAARRAHSSPPMSIAHANDALTDHMRNFSGQCLKMGTFASAEFDRLYLDWIRARWDAADQWVRSVWVGRP